MFFPHSDSLLINNFIDCSLLVPRASDNVLVIHGDIAAKHRRGLFGLKESERGKREKKRVYNALM